MSGKGLISRMSDECLMKQETVISLYVVYQAVMRKFTLAMKTILVPLEEFGYTILNFHFVGPAEAMKLGDIDELAHGAVGFRGVKDDFALEADGFDDEFGEFTDGELFAGANVDVAVADLAKAGDITTAACGVVTVNGAICGGTEMNRRVFLDAYDVAEVDIQEYMDGGICHVLRPEELTEGGAGAPQDNTVVVDTILCENIQYSFSFF